MEKRIEIDFITHLKILAVIYPLPLIAFISLMILKYEPKKQRIQVESDTEVNNLTINAIQNRGGIFINDTLVIRSYSKLIKNVEGFKGWRSDGPIISFSSEPYVHTLGDLSPPYQLSKEKNNDTIIVRKDGYELKFLLDNGEE